MGPLLISCLLYPMILLHEEVTVNIYIMQYHVDLAWKFLEKIKIEKGNGIKKYKRLDIRERKVYNSKLLASKNTFLACLCFCSFFFFFFPFPLSWRRNLLFDMLGYSRSH